MIDWSTQDAGRPARSDPRADPPHAVGRGGAAVRVGREDQSVRRAALLSWARGHSATSAGYEDFQYVSLQRGPREGRPKVF